jgi:hypothetical protein
MPELGEWPSPTDRLAITMISLGVWAPAPGVRSKQVV